MIELDCTPEDAVIIITALNQLKRQLSKFDSDEEYFHIRQFMDKEVDRKIEALIGKLTGKH